MTCKWLITMVIVSPLTGVIPLYKWPKFMACKWGVILTTYDTWDEFSKQLKGFVHWRNSKLPGDSGRDLFIP